MISNFVSCFKIDGIPILPPVMTPEVRIEASQYRQKAVEIERKLLESKSIRDTSLASLEYGNNIAESTTPLPIVEPQDFIAPAMSSPENTLSVRRNSFTLEAPSPGLKNLPHSTSPVVCQREAIEELTSNSDNDDSPKPRLIRSNSYTLDSPSPLLMKHMLNQSMNIKNSTSMGEISTDGTMKAHVKRLDFGHESHEPAAPKKTPKSGGGKPKWISSKKVTPKSATTPVKKLKSPYESASKVSQKNAGKGRLKVTRKGNTTAVSSCDLKPEVTDCQQRIREIQVEHEMRVMKLLKRQEEEQLLLQESFRRQQEELMKMLPAPVLDQIHTSTPLLVSPNESTCDEDNQRMLPSFRKLNISSKEFVHNNDSQSSIGNISSSQTLFVSSNTSRTSADFEDSDELYKTCENNSNNNRTSDDVNGNLQYHGIRNYIETIGQGLQDKDLQELSRLVNTEETPCFRSGVQHHAASVINAYARGYLTRRLFQTDRVQKVVQIIRDTLLFILDLHHEKTARRQIRSPADVQLKRTLLHQLTSACYQLHEIFFDTTIRERMEIIGRDRDNLRRRLENRPRTASSIGSGKSIRSAASAAAHKQQLSIRKLQMCSLKH